MAQENLADILLRSLNMQPATPPGQLNTNPMQMAQPQGFDLSQLAAQGNPAPDTSGLFGRPRRDPALTMALINAGISMMQPTPAGQTHLGHAARGIGIGAQSFIQESERQTKNKRLDRQEARAEKALGLQERQVGLQEKGDARQEEQFQYSKTRRDFQESIDALRKDGLEVGLDMAKLERDLKKKFGAREAEARLDQLLANAEYYKGGGRAGAAKVASKVQEIEHRAASMVAAGEAKTIEEARIASWKQEDIARSAQATGVQQRGEIDQEKLLLEELGIWQRAKDATFDDKEKAVYQKNIDAIQAKRNELKTQAPPPARTGTAPPAATQGGHVFPDGTPVNYNTVRAMYLRQNPNAKEADIDREVNAYLQSLPQ